MAFWDIAIFVLLEDKLVNLGPIDFQMGLPFNTNVNEGQNKFEVHISKYMAKMANFRPKIGQPSGRHLCPNFEWA